MPHHRRGHRAPRRAGRRGPTGLPARGGPSVLERAPPGPMRLSADRPRHRIGRLPHRAPPFLPRPLRQAFSLLTQSPSGAREDRGDAKGVSGRRIGGTTAGTSPGSSEPRRSISGARPGISRSKKPHFPCFLEERAQVEGAVWTVSSVPSRPPDGHPSRRRSASGGKVSRTAARRSTQPGSETRSGSYAREAPS
jgi:hypothetical protein